jgi:hypothetical protein
MWFSRLRAAAANLLRGERRDRDLDDEVRAYVELLVDEQVARGVPPAEARRSALVKVGGVEQVKNGSGMSAPATLWNTCCRTFGTAPGCCAVARGSRWSRS